MSGKIAEIVRPLAYIDLAVQLANNSSNKAPDLRLGEDRQTCSIDILSVQDVNEDSLFLPA